MSSGFAQFVALEVRRSGARRLRYQMPEAVAFDSLGLAKIIPSLREPEQDLRQTLQITIASESYSRALDSFYRIPSLRELEQSPQTDLTDHPSLRELERSP